MPGDFCSRRSHHASNGYVVSVVAPSRTVVHLVLARVGSSLTYDGRALGQSLAVAAQALLAHPPIAFKAPRSSRSDSNGSDSRKQHRAQPDRTQMLAFTRELKPTLSGRLRAGGIAQENNLIDGSKGPARAAGQVETISSPPGNASHWRTVARAAQLISRVRAGVINGAGSVVDCPAHPGGHDAVLCYRAEDGHHLAGRVCLGLKRQGLTVFTSDTCAISRQDAFASCQAVVVLVTEGLLNPAVMEKPDDPCRIEIEVASEAGIPIIPLIQEGFTEAYAIAGGGLTGAPARIFDSDSVAVNNDYFDVGTMAKLANHIRTRDAEVAAGDLYHAPIHRSRDPPAGDGLGPQ